MKRRRVKITGIGPVTPAGIGREEFAKGMAESISRVVQIRRLDSEAGDFVGAEVRGFRVTDFLEADWPKKRPRHTQFAIAGALLALKDAGISLTELSRERPLIVTGTSLMDGETVIKSIAGVATKGPRFGSVRAVMHAPVGTIPNDVAKALGVTARTLVISTSCCAGADAIGVAANMIASGEADIALCGGTEAPLNLHPMLELKMAGLAPGNPDNPERQSRPFDLWRTTGVIGEGSAIIVLEPDESPRRGYAYLDGYGFGMDDEERHPSEGLYGTGRLALANAGASPGEIDQISAWGPGHRLIDAIESAALRRLFGERLWEIPAVSIKGALGNALAAAGAMQIACAAIGMEKGFIPPTVNWQYPDPDCPLNLSAQMRSLKSSTVLVNAHGLSGTNSSLLLRRCR
jgi:3-oxoacyl-(acyl-carrier-protein) synthase